jgi:DNA-binding response OmpR family regulator
MQGIKKVLAIDDSVTNNVLLEAILTNKGYQIYTVLNAKEANAVLKKENIDLILLDLLMPEISGVDLLKTLKNNDNTKLIPVMIVSAVSDPETKHEVMDLGADDFLNKPIDINLFIEKVENLIS